MDGYAFRGGEAGASRLEVLDAVLGPDSRWWLAAAGLREGMRVVEVGCGTGAMTAWIAETVGPAGRVAAVDADARQIDLARAAAARKGISTIDFFRRRIPDEDLPAGEYDLAYARLVLMHVRDPEGALRSMVRALKPGGLLVCEEATARTAFAFPPDDVVIRTGRLFEDLGRALGVDFDIGDRLFELVRHQGCRLAGARFVQPMVPLAFAARFLGLGAAEVRPALLRAGLITEAEADGLLESIRGLAAKAGGYYAFGRIAQVAGTV